MREDARQKNDEKVRHRYGSGVAAPIDILMYGMKLIRKAKLQVSVVASSAGPKQAVDNKTAASGAAEVDQGSIRQDGGKKDNVRSKVSRSGEGR